MHTVRQLPAPTRRTLGPQGPGVSPLAWGMWRFKGDDTGQAQALDQEPTAARIGDQANFAEGLDEARGGGCNGDVTGHGQGGTRARGHRTR